MILRQQHEKSAFQKDGLLDRLKDFLNDIDLSVIFTDEEVREADERPRAARRLAMPSSPVPQNASDDGEIAGTVEVLKTQRPTANLKFFTTLQKQDPQIFRKFARTVIWTLLKRPSCAKSEGNSL